MMKKIFGPFVVLLLLLVVIVFSPMILFPSQLKYGTIHEAYTGWKESLRILFFKLIRWEGL